MVKYNCLAPTHTIMPVAIETLGVGPRSLRFIRDSGIRIAQKTGATDYLLQQPSVAVQRGNAVAVRGSVGGSSTAGLVWCQ